MNKLFVDGNRCCTLTFSEVDEEKVNVEIVEEKGEKGKKVGKEGEGEGRKDGRFRETHDNDASKNDELEDKVRIRFFKILFLDDQKVYKYLAHTFYLVCYLLSLGGGGCNLIFGLNS